MQVEPADLDDAVELLALREAAAQWQQARGIRQWVPGELGLDMVRDQIRSGGTFVVRDALGIAASVRLLWADPGIWGHDPDHRAGYVHGLMARDRGTGAGRRLLQWTEVATVRSGRSVVRLDCVSSNAALRTYYRQLGYVESGCHVFDVPGVPALTTFEKVVRGQ